MCTQSLRRQSSVDLAVRAFSQSLSFFFGDVSEANGREVSHGPRDPKRFGREKKRGKECFSTW